MANTKKTTAKTPREKQLEKNKKATTEVIKLTEKVEAAAAPKKAPAKKAATENGSLFFIADERKNEIIGYVCEVYHGKRKVLEIRQSEKEALLFDSVEAAEETMAKLGNPKTYVIYEQ